MEHWRKGAKAFIGPEMNCRTEATMAAAQNLPIISHKCKDQTVSDKKKYPTFARTVPSETKITRSLMALLQYHKWKKFTIIYEERPENTELYNAIKHIIETENNGVGENERYLILNTSILEYPFSEVEKSVEHIGDIIQETYSNTRSSRFKILNFEFFCHFCILFRFFKIELVIMQKFICYTYCYVLCVLKCKLE